jgi:hypothetical protein
MAGTSIKKSKKIGRTIGRAVIFLVLLILAISFLYPLYYMLINSLKSLSGYYVNPFGLPREQLQWQNFVTMVSQFKILELFGNSFIISFFTVVGLVVFGTLAAYSFAKVEFKGKNGIYLAILATLFVPAQVTMIPMYISFAKVGLVDNYLGVIIAYWDVPAGNHHAHDRELQGHPKRVDRGRDHRRLRISGAAASRSHAGRLARNFADDHLFLHLQLERSFHAHGAAQEHG